MLISMPCIAYGYVFAVRPELHYLPPSSYGKSSHQTVLLLLTARLP
jgi:hypothetical protein